MSGQDFVYVVDDDAAVRHLLSYRLSQEGFAVETFADAAAFMRGYDGRRSCCVVTDLVLPRMGGLELQLWVAGQAAPAPVIIISGRADLPSVTAAFRGGSFDFLEKPFDDGYLVERIRHALAQHARKRQALALRRDAEARYRRLSRRERDVAALLAAGRSTKEIAAALGLGTRTVESHRFQAMKKLSAASLSDLTRIIAILED